MSVKPVEAKGKGQPGTMGYIPVVPVPNDLLNMWYAWSDEPVEVDGMVSLIKMVAAGRVGAVLKVTKVACAEAVRTGTEAQLATEAVGAE
jgi:hypothetical protein